MFYERKKLINYIRLNIIWYKIKENIFYFFESLLLLINIKYETDF